MRFACQAGLLAILLQMASATRLLARPENYSQSQVITCSGGGGGRRRWEGHTTPKARLY